MKHLSIIATALIELIHIYSWVLLIYIFMSWVPSVQNSQIGYWFARVSEPFLSPFRRIIPPIGGALDLSPIVAFLVLRLASRGIEELFWILG